MTAAPGQALSALLLTLLLGLTGEPEHCPQGPSEWAGITHPSHSAAGEAELSCLPACQGALSYVFLSVDLVGNGAEGSFGGRRRKM